MPDTIHRNFKTVEDAESARAALLEAGFQGSAVQLNLHDARAVDTPTLAVENIMESLTPDDADDTDRPVHRPAALLSVDVDNGEQREQATALMLRYGGTEA
ncbi:hypothetical protein [Pseudoduganella albidiflava]|uniref:Uncharacterized protein n=1 Tax=Pseudoduganella albidiflava TaxID=321983 RepID=A0A411X286_9BURK|nr:hypothetical protein [Pseudoduganella albidiflava]QBI03116.1 hypothetical protein EYF70_21480 [Pseudoduganella albidiflava]GGY69934.1 hypothetical protein GCM10007387_59880 [Pseudoduganella albidiflava]